MKVLAIVTSCRKNGNTARLVRMIAARLEASAAGRGQSLRLESLYLGDQDIRPCRGCRACFDRGENHCLQQDDIPCIAAKVRLSAGHRGRQPDGTRAAPVW